MMTRRCARAHAKMHPENRCTLKRGGREGRNVRYLTLTHDRPEGRPLSQGTPGLNQAPQ